MTLFFLAAASSLAWQASQVAIAPDCQPGQLSLALDSGDGRFDGMGCTRR